jgi:hypothetical protein
MRSRLTCREAAYIVHAIITHIDNLTTCVFPLPAAIPSAQGLSDALKQTKVNVAFAVPYMVEEMSRNVKLLDHIA